MENQKKRASQGTVDLAAVISDTIDRIKKIDGHADWDQSEKTRRHKVLAESVKNKLHEDGRRSDENKVSLATYRRYLTDVRKAITAENMHHHNLEKKLDVLARRYPKHNAELLAIKRDNISDTRLAHKAALESLIDESEAYSDLKAIIIDHEIMRHLSMASAQKTKLSNQQQAALEEKKHNAVEIDKDWLLVTTESLLKPDTDSQISFARLALGIAFATGRRAIEVLYQGNFEAAGKYELTFSGFAKKRGGADYSNKARIYTIVPASDVLAAVELLRQQPEIEAMRNDFGSLPEGERNRAVNHRAAANLNNTAKRVFGDETRVFRDSRAVWARFVFEEHFRKDPRWKKLDEDVFWHQQLGHEDLDTQQAYKQFKLIDVERGGDQDRLSAVKALARNPEVMKRGALQKINAWAVSVLENDPTDKITQHRIISELGSGRGVIKDWLTLAEDALNLDPVANRTQKHEEKPQRKEESKPAAQMDKPRIRATKDGGWWLVSIEIDGAEYEYTYHADEYGRGDAMAAAWAEHAE
jgi:hypothetical protein